MGWFSRLFSKEKKKEPITSPKVQGTMYQPSIEKNGLDNEVRTPKPTIARTFQGTFVSGNPYNNPRNPKTGRFEKKK